VNIRVRTSPGIDGPVILAAWCPTCDQEAMPMSNGTCGWCDTPIIGPHGASAKKAPRANRKLGPRITEQDIAQMLQHEAARLGRPPYSREWTGVSRSTILRRFGSWSAALEAAGL